MRGLLSSICGLQDTGEGSRASTKYMPRGKTCLSNIRNSPAIPSQGRCVCILGQKKEVQFSGTVQVLHMMHSVISQDKFISGTEAWEAAPAHTRGGFGLFSPFGLCTSVRSSGAPLWFWQDVLESVIIKSLLSQAVLCLLVSSQRRRMSAT